MLRQRVRFYYTQGNTKTAAMAAPYSTSGSDAFPAAEPLQAVGNCFIQRSVQRSDEALLIRSPGEGSQFLAGQFVVLNTVHRFTLPNSSPKESSIRKNSLIDYWRPINLVQTWPCKYLAQSKRKGTLWYGCMSFLLEFRTLPE